MRQHGQTISGAVYQKLEWGPAPHQLRPVRDYLVATSQAKIVEASLGDRTEQRLIPLRAADTSVFNSGELAVIDHVLEMMRPLQRRPGESDVARGASLVSARVSRRRSSPNWRI